MTMWVLEHLTNHSALYCFGLGALCILTAIAIMYSAD